MAYLAITFDTQVVKTNSFDFDGGVLNQLKALRHYDIEVILSEMVYQEIIKHLRIHTQSVVSKFNSALKAARDFGVVADTLVLPLQGSPEEVSDKRLNAYLGALEVDVIPNNKVSLDDVVSLYIKANPPFASSGSKKAEFPDAIALLSLERWAKEVGGKILAISSDADWMSFGASSDYIDVVPDIPTALNNLWDQSDATRVLAHKLIHLIEGKDEELCRQLSLEIGHALELGKFRGLARSKYWIDAPPPKVKLIGFELKDTDHFDLLSHDETGHLFTISVPAVLKVTAETWFFFSDKDQKDQVLGSTRVEKQAEMEVLLMIAVAYNGQEVLEILHVELLNAPPIINFGEIFPDGPRGGDEQNSLF
ncbi:PIN domain-containing protein [Agrobacterium tumefaciens]|uniref:PIN domain-containing protein n=1 Tax=Agrobacterium tumefaciens TaxID=358 RepID=UPI0015744209|nr:DUF4935 domain-containing protein [Agrobacterium tumefaciens]NTD09997.1 DUF4935 domain-containing protein [Agrobacterium tumefaciens]